jgi:predicted metal-binding membrane protein
MLVMLALGTGSLGWMLLLAAVMAIEKNARWGRRLSAPLGLALLAWAAVLLATHTG